MKNKLKYLGISIPFLIIIGLAIHAYMMGEWVSLIGFCFVFILLASIVNSAKN